MRAFTVLVAVGALCLAAFLPARALAGPYGYYGGRYYPAPGVNSAYPVSPAVFPHRTFNYAGPVYPMFGNYYSAPAVNSYYYQAPAPSYYYTPQMGSYYAQPSYYYAQPSVGLYAGSYYP